MPTNYFLPSYERAFRKFVKREFILKQKVKEKLVLFAENPQHPSLHLEKLSGSDIWTIRIDQGNRLFFVWSDTGDTAIFFLVGSHDAYRRVKNK